MKIIVKIFVFLLVHNSVYAQELTNNYKPKIDSLQSLLNRKNHDTTRLMLMHSLAQVYAYNLELVKSVEMIHSAQELNKKLKFPKGYAAEYRSIASLMDRPTNDYFQNYTRWEFEKIKQKDDFFALNLSYPDLKEESRMKFVKIRIQQLRESLTYAKKTNNNKLVGLIYNNLSANYMFLGDAKTVNPMYLDDYRKAIIYADSTLIVWEKLNETSLSIYPLLIQNFCYNKLGDAIKAKEPEIKSNTILAGLESPQEKMIHMSGMSNKYFFQQRYALSVEYALKAMDAAILLKDTLQQIKNYLLLGRNYYQKSMSKKAIDNFKKAIEVYEINRKDEYDFIRFTYYTLGYLYVALKEYDQAKKYFAEGNALFQLSNNKDIIRQGKFDQLKSKGAILMSQELYAEALANFFESFKFEKDTINNLSNTNYRIAFCYQKLGNLKKSILYGERSYKSTPKIDKKQLLETSKLLEEVYKQNNQPSKAYEYLQIHDKILTDNAAEEISNSIADAEIKAIIDKSDQEKQKLEQEKAQKIRESKMQRWLIFSIAMALLSALVILYILSRNNRQKQAANDVLEKTLSNLKSTQAQLIQSEKMASLGELTAGIAHEIQNPLNFVNNFSEVSNEIISELKVESSKVESERDKELEKELLNDIEQNLTKINHHGKRASDIVKGMLEHSRKSTGEKEPTDINALADEYLRLAYHGLRAKDKDFNATMETHFDPKLPKIDIIPQDIGRVLLNLINNAFYAVSEKSKVESQKHDSNYQPTVSITTQLTTNTQLIIAIKDNGSGIPEHIKDKIFQPFFTTKPTGQGTGLGLSLSYDIVKAHGGEIKVNTREIEDLPTGDAETEFIIQIPAL